MAALPRVRVPVPEALRAAESCGLYVPDQLEAGLYQQPGSPQVGSGRLRRDGVRGGERQPGGLREGNACGLQGPAQSKSVIVTLVGLHIIVGPLLIINGKPTTSLVKRLSNHTNY